MRARPVNENIEFKRGQEPKGSLDIGMTSERWFKWLLKKLTALGEVGYVSPPTETGWSISFDQFPDGYNWEIYGYSDGTYKLIGKKWMHGEHQKWKEANFGDTEKLWNQLIKEGLLLMDHHIDKAKDDLKHVTNEKLMWESKINKLNK